MSHFGPMGHFPLFPILAGLFQLAILALLVVVVVRLFSRSGQAQSARPALAVLEERYARGEILREEFMERRAVLLGQAPPSGPHPPTSQPPTAQPPG
jgi:uncharacterized membrane protein